MNKELFLLLAGIGLFTLSILSIQPPEKVKISSIEASDIGAKVAVTGNTSIMYSTDEATFIEIEDKTGRIEAVSFSDFPGFEGSSLVTGRVDLYQGQLQLIVDEASLEFERPVGN